MKNLKRFGDFGMNEEDKGNWLDTLPVEVKTVKDAEKLLLALAKADKIYHFDDDPHDVVNAINHKELFTENEADIVKKLVDQAFDICAKHYGKQHGFWEGLIKDVFMGYIAFTADEDQATADMYVVAGGGKNNVKVIPQLRYDEQLGQMYDEDNGEYDETAVDKWFGKLKNA